MKGAIGDIMDHNGNTPHDRALSRGYHTLAGLVEKWLAGTVQICSRSRANWPRKRWQVHFGMILPRTAILKVIRDLHVSGASHGYYFEAVVRDLHII